MPLEVKIERVERDVILELRRRVLSGPGIHGASLSKDLAPATRHWAAWMGGTVVGCVSVMRLRGWALRGMAVSVKHQRHGVGARLLDFVCAEVDAPMWCNARLETVSFYSQLGWAEVGPIFTMQERLPHQRMTWRPSTDEGVPREIEEPRPR